MRPGDACLPSAPAWRRVFGIWPRLTMGLTRMMMRLPGSHAMQIKGRNVAGRAILPRTSHKQAQTGTNGWHSALRENGFMHLRVTIALMLVCGCVISALSFGPRASIGLFLLPVTETHGWSRELFSLAIALQNLVWGAAQPFAGIVADRYGPARVLAAGGLVYAAGLGLASVSATPGALLVTAGLLIGLGVAMTSFSLVMAVFGRVVSPRRRLIAFGVGTASGSLGQFIFAPLSQGFIAQLGWQNALLALAAITATIMLFSLALRLPKALPAPAASGPAEQRMAAAIGEAFRNRGYALLMSGFFVCGFQLAFITVHLQPYIVDIGFDARLGAWAIGLIGLFNVIGAFAAGFSDKVMTKPVFLALIYLARAAIVCLFIVLPPSPLTLMAFAIVIGLLWLSTVPPTMGIVASLFGPRYVATLFGFVFFVHQLGSFFGVWIGGALFEATGSYDIVWWLSIVLAVLAALVHLPIRDTPAPGLAGMSAPGGPNAPGR